MTPANQELVPELEYQNSRMRNLYSQISAVAFPSNLLEGKKFGLRSSSASHHSPPAI